ncbi:unnamed protein product [Pedinophyceae sp. YPF-701]|nr:unnamed protein product [Pedinophyceae sp. YPF-701]
MFHFGHAKALEQAKKSFPNTTLIVGVCSDRDTRAYKGKSVMNEAERLESVRHCRWVDEVVEPSEVPWVINNDFLDKYNIDYVAHDALPYADASGQAGGGDVYEPLRKMGRFYETQRTEGVSTSDLILRIVRDYNDYVMRNLKRGYSRSDLNVSWSREKRLQASENVRQLSRHVREQQRLVGTRLEAMRNGILANMNKMARGGEELAGKMMRGDMQQEVAQRANTAMNGFVKQFERNYQALESFVSQTISRMARRRAREADLDAGAAAADEAPEGETPPRVSTSSDDVPSSDAKAEENVVVGAVAAGRRAARGRAASAPEVAAF